MPANYVLIQKVVVGSAGVSTVTFNNIPQTGYTDLVVRGSVRCTTAAAFEDLSLSLNGANLSRRLRVGGNGSAAFSDVYDLPTPGIAVGATATASTFSNFELYIPNYSGNTNKSISYDTVTENNSISSVTQLVAGIWNSTSAITSMTFYVASASLVEHSTFYLYGIAKAGVVPTVAPYATGGDTISSDGTYFIHTFRTSGTFTPKKSLSNVDYLVVAGGGGGGSGASSGGGGGAGGYRTSIGGSTLSLTPTNYAVTIGAGGSGGTSSTGAGTQGTNSTFSSITSTGGGFGSSFQAPGGVTNGGAGGSGGGAGGYGGGGGTGLTGGAASPSGQGNAGGNGAPGPNNYQGGGGGGGAGAVGANAVTVTGGNGGNGLANSISGSSVTYAGGGGGGTNEVNTGFGTGGTGGGGRAGYWNGSSITAAVAGTANLGGGGGGAGSNGATGGAGGSGIVIVRYPI